MEALPSTAEVGQNAISVSHFNSKLDGLVSKQKWHISGSDGVRG